MPARPPARLTFPTYDAFLRSRWPARTRLLSVHAFFGSLTFVVLDWLFTRLQARPPSLAFIALLRLPWAALPVIGYVLQHRAPAWRHLPKAIVGLSVLWIWGSVLGYFAIGLEGSVIQALTLFAGLVTTAALMPISGLERAGFFALVALGYVAFDLSWPHPVPLALRVIDDAAVVGFAVIQIVVFQTFAAARRKAVLLRHRLERAVAGLAASRERAAAAVEEVGRLAADVAHQVNNPLAAVKVNVRWLANDGSLPENAAERPEVVQDSLEAIERIAAIVQDLKQRAVAHEEALHRDDAAQRADEDG